MFKKFFLPLFFMFLINSVNGACFTPANWTTITVNSDITLCKNYYLGVKFDIAANGVTLDCNWSILNGGYSSSALNGIYSTNRNDYFTVKNCILKNWYSHAIYLIGTTNITLTNMIVNDTIYLRGCSNSSFQNITINSGALSMYYTSDSHFKDIVIDGSLALYEYCLRNNFTNLEVFGSTGAGISIFRYSDLNNFYNAYIHNNGDGVVLAQPSSTYIVSNNKFYNSNFTNNSFSNIACNEGSHGMYFENCISENSQYGLYLNYCKNSIFKNMKMQNNYVDIYLPARSTGNSFLGIKVGKNKFSEIKYGGGVKVVEADVSENLPTGLGHINKFFDIKNTSANAWSYIKIAYAESDLGNIDESSLRIYKNTSGTWESCEGASWANGCGVNTTGNYVWANITAFSTFGVLGTTSEPVPEFSDMFLFVLILTVFVYLVLNERW